jgi:hypothetical protein
MRIPKPAIVLVVILSVSVLYASIPSLTENIAAKQGDKARRVRLLEQFVAGDSPFLTHLDDQSLN